MGFYTPAQLLQDARRHQVEVRPVDVNFSHWDCTLEYDNEEQSPQPKQRGAIRLGLRLVKGLSREAAEQLLRKRPESGFYSVADARQRCRLKRNDWDALAAAGSFNQLSQHRYQARWDLLQDLSQLPLDTAIQSQVTEPHSDYGSSIQLAAPSEQADLEEDFQHLGLSLGRHPLALLRERQMLTGCVNAQQLQQCRHGQLVKVAGLVTNRQRPGTASGVTFVSLEDETGQINLVVWQATARAQKRALLGAQILKVAGVVEKEGLVIHVVAGRLTDISQHWQAIKVKSRDFR